MYHYHTELLNYIAKKIGANSYLEIGIFNPSHNFDLINVSNKLGVDPAIKNRVDVYEGTSDEYFKGYDRKFDLIFVDGLHEKEQVKKDIINSFNCLNEGGVIVIHDCNPHSKKVACYPRGGQRE